LIAIKYSGVVTLEVNREFSQLYIDYVADTFLLVVGDEHNYFILCYRKFSDHDNQRYIRTAHGGKVGCNAVEYTTTFCILIGYNFYGTVQKPV